MGEVIKRRLSFGDEEQAEDLVPVIGNGDGEFPKYVVPVSSVQLVEYAVEIRTAEVELAQSFISAPEFRLRVRRMLVNRVAESLIDSGEFTMMKEEGGQTIHGFRLVIAKNRRR